MSIKRDGILNIMWGVAVVVLAITASAYAYRYYSQYLADGFGMPAALGNIGQIVICGAVFIAALGIIYLIITLIAGLLSKHSGVGESAKNGWAALAVIAVIIFGLYYRATLIAGLGDLTSLDASSVFKDTTLYESAKIGASGAAASFSDSIHGMSYLYVRLLSVFMLFLGNSVLAPVVLQVVIHVLCILFAFGTCKRFFGYSAGLITTAILSFSQLFIRTLLEASPGCLLAMFFLMGMYMLSVFHTMENYSGKVVYGVFAGLIMGAGIYLDAYLVILIVIWLVAFIHETAVQKKNKAADFSDDDMTPTGPYLSMLIAIAVGLAASLAVDSFISGSGYISVLSTWFGHNFSAAFPFVYYSAADFRVDTEALVLIGLAVMSVFGYFRCSECDCYGMWIIMALAATSPFMRAGFLETDTCSVVIFAVIAGIGVRDMVTGNSLSARDKALNAAFDYIMASEETEAKAHRSEKPDKKADVKPEVKSAGETKDNPEWETLNVSEDKTTPKAAAAEETEAIAATAVAAATEIAEEKTEAEQTKSETPEPEQTKSEAVQPEQTKSETPEPEQTKSETAKKSSPEMIPQVDDLPGMIPNPLPLPARKKHVQMDYGHEVPEKLMHYDIEINEADDFDI